MCVFGWAFLPSFVRRCMDGWTGGGIGSDSQRIDPGSSPPGSSEQPDHPRGRYSIPFGPHRVSGIWHPPVLSTVWEDYFSMRKEHVTEIACAQHGDGAGVCRQRS